MLRPLQLPAPTQTSSSVTAADADAGDHICTSGQSPAPGPLTRVLLLQQSITRKIALPPSNVIPGHFNYTNNTLPTPVENVFWAPAHWTDVQRHEKCSCSSQEHANDLLTRKQTKMFPVKMPKCRNEGRRGAGCVQFKCFAPKWQPPYIFSNILTL